MTNEKKLTKADKFALIANIEDVKNNPVLAEFVAKEIELLTKKNTERKPSATQVANRELCDKVVAFLQEHAEEKFTISDLIKQCEACAGLSNQKVTAITRMLEADKLIEKVVEKRKPYFKLA